MNRDSTKWLDEIEAQADETCPYYLPRLIQEIRSLRAAREAQTQEIAQREETFKAAVKAISSWMDRAEKAEKEVTRLSEELQQTQADLTHLRAAHVDGEHISWNEIALRQQRELAALRAELAQRRAAIEALVERWREHAKRAVDQRKAANYVFFTNAADQLEVVIAPVSTDQESK